MTIIASISKLGNVKSLTSSSIGSSKNSGASFGSNSSSANCGCGSLLGGAGTFLGGVVNSGAGLATQIPVNVSLDVSANANPSLMSGGSAVASPACGCN